LHGGNGDASILDIRISPHTTTTMCAIVLSRLSLSTALTARVTLRT
jgi:hypothetical protein